MKEKRNLLMGGGLISAFALWTVLIQWQIKMPGGSVMEYRLVAYFSAEMGRTAKVAKEFAQAAESGRQRRSCSPMFPARKSQMPG